MVTLLPFAQQNAAVPNISLRADLTINHGSIKLMFNLKDPGHLIADSLVPGSWTPETLVRKHDLWKTTCFEAFWSLPGEKKYWELNLSGQGAWNIYSFFDYRQPQPPKESNEFKIKNVTIDNENLVCDLSTRINLSQLDVSICAVIKTKDTETYYYSNQHAGEKADFHLRQNFSIFRGS